ncbi:hypothetical protein NLJ89_g505 [Agrocybe chaxingu]|uniref:NADP-dependent oxidoreductase domain-containing protein n=1 Tax=Agrocybe chaxingu TaxID=84603 RepID=A0A9W8N1T5_9AGAR|nr:hypothetical protein NLJ89_g505 [Agrocybe chaxingu]
MPFKDIPLNDGNKIPAIAYGTGSVNKGKDVHLYVEQAIEVGFSHIDTAQYYQNEEHVGTAIRETGLARPELFVTTKYGGGSVSGAFDDSLRKLGLKYIDLYLIHNPRGVENGDLEGTWRKFEKFQEEGLAKSIGVSNFAVEDLQKVLKTARVKPAVNQIHLHPYNVSENKELLEYHAKHGIVTEANEVSTHPPNLGLSRGHPGGPVDVPVKKAAERLGITPTQVVFLWVRAKGAVIVTTSSSKEHLLEYLAVGDLPDLTEEEVAAIDAAGANGPPSFLTRHGRLWAQVVLALLLVQLLFYYSAFGGLMNWHGQ